MNELTHLDLFSGIGGFALAAQRAGFRTVGFSEVDPYACRVLAERFPGVPHLGDVRNLESFNGFEGIDVLTGGFPCQPYSVAGQQRKDDDRILWPAMLGVVDKLRPSWIIGENVSGFVHLGLEKAITDLENQDYQVRAFLIPACGVGAHHERERVWIVAHRNHDGLRDADGEWLCLKCGRPIFDGCPCDHGEWQCADCGEWTYPFHYDFADGCSHCGSSNVTHAVRQRGPRRNAKRQDAKDAWQPSGNPWSNAGAVGAWDAEPSVGRVADGIPNRSHRLKGLGNAIVPQVAEPFFHWIAQIERGEITCTPTTSS